MKIRVEQAVALYTILSGCVVSKLQSAGLADKLIEIALTLLPIVRKFEIAESQAAELRKEKKSEQAQQLLYKTMNEETECSLSAITKADLREIAMATQGWTLGFVGAFWPLLEREVGEK